MSILLAEDPTGETDRQWLSVKEYDRMAGAGVFHPDARIELLNGEIVTMSPIGDAHHYVVVRLDALLQRDLADRAVVSIQGPLLCGGWSEPEPDVVVSRGPHERYLEGRPHEADALLVVEVADSSLQRDQRVKVPLYGSLEVPEVWVVDLPNRKVHVYTDPKDGEYATYVVMTTDDTLVPTAFPDVEIPVAELRLDHSWPS